MRENFRQKVERYLKQLCVEITDRSVGSPGNQQAVKLVAKHMHSCGFKTETPEFDCIDWNDRGSKLTCLGRSFEVFTSPYTLGCSARAELSAASTIDELKAVNAENKILLLHGELCKEQLMPEAFPFYNPESHKEIRKLLLDSGAKAIITATGRNPELAGGMYPFPMIEDGDFNIPSVYMKDSEGEKLFEVIGQTAELTINSERIPSKGSNVIARTGSGKQKRILITAHIDSKKGTPGAIDNATGIVILMLLAEKLNNYCRDNLIEIVAFNGEDYYSIPGQMQYLSKTSINDIDLVINMDGAGFHKEKTAFSFYGCSKQTETKARDVFNRFQDIQEGPQWYQSDHGMFIQSDIPAIAITSTNFMEKLSVELTHTSEDTFEKVNLDALVEIAAVIEEIIKTYE